MISTRLILLSVLVLASISVGGCHRHGEKEFEGGQKTEYYLPTLRQNAPEPVYSRTRWGHLPSVLPEREMPGTESRMAAVGGEALRPVFHLQLKNSSLEETARVLAALSRYSSYTAPSIASKKLTIENLGTVDELAALISKKAEVQVLVDHENKEVRFLAPTTESAELPSE